MRPRSPLAASPGLWETVDRAKRGWRPLRCGLRAEPALSERSARDDGRAEKPRYGRNLPADRQVHRERHMASGDAAGLPLVGASARVQHGLVWPFDVIVELVKHKTLQLVEQFFPQLR